MTSNGGSDTVQKLHNARLAALIGVREALRVFWESAEAISIGTAGMPGSISLEAVLATSRLGLDAAALLKAARAGDKDAAFILSDMAIAAMKGGSRMPETLITFVEQTLRGELDPPLKPGRRRTENDIRNMGIALAVEHVSRGFGLSDREAGDIVKKALEECGIHMEANSIQKIWRQGRGVFRPAG